MARRVLRERLPTQMQLHLMLEMDRLPDLVQELAVAALQGAGCETLDEETRTRASAAVENVLRRYVRAFEFCGFTLECHASREYDPWEIREEVGTWEGI